MATRKAYGDALAALGGERGDVVALDGEVSNSTYAEIFGKAYPERFFEMYIAEQQMVAAAVGMQVLGWKPFASTFAAFLSRAYDFVRMAAISQRDDQAVPARTPASRSARTARRRWRSRTWPRCARSTAPRCSTRATRNQTAQLVRAMADLEGISYLRTTRAKTAVLYGPTRSSRSAARGRCATATTCAIVARGITLHEALKAADAARRRRHRRRA